MKTRTVSAAVVLLGAATSTLAQVGADGIDWAIVGAPGDAPWTGYNYPLSPTYGRGEVDYVFKIGRTEVTTAQWMEFFNAALARPDPLPFVGLRWWLVPGTFNFGAIRDTTYSGPGMRYRLRTDIANAGMVPVSAVSWRMCAVLANWLHNGKSTAQSAFMSGSYDVSSFTPEIAYPQFNDQRTRSPGARFWIPSLDEYMKAGYYDPNKNGPGQGGWWQQPNGSDTPLIYGPPQSFGGDGTGQANSGFSLAGHAERNIPLAAYGNVRGPWGLLDVAGGTAEWMEDTWGDSTELYRMLDGSNRSVTGTDVYDDVTRWGSASPWYQNSDFGVRLASAVSTQCPADVDDGSGLGLPDGGVTIEDLIYYIAAFSQGIVAADLDDGSGTGTHDGGVTIEDLLFFLEHFAAGC